ncbi:MAG: diaminopimelate epimerase [Woeseiaceae bacterium]|nr:diaminopimelate epimerase [Woeseiaceae bacterium]
MQLEYTLMHGAGNRIVVIDERSSGREPPGSEQLALLADAHTGVGFDQLMWLTTPRDAAARARYRVFNADGSEVEQCGNGVRCVAWLLSDAAEDEDIALEGPAGAVTSRVLGPNRVSVDMGAPVFEPDSIPFVAESAAICHELTVNGETLDVSVVSMGNPHCVLTVEDVNTADVAALGPAIELHERFPVRTNVGFMAVPDRGHVELRVHERGVGETLACGTGACAAVVAARRRGLVDDDVVVSLPGGELMVSWRGRDTDPVWLTGQAEILSEGTIDI